MIKKWIVTLVICISIAAVLVTYKVMDNRAEEQLNALAPEYSETVDAVSVTKIDYQPAVNVLGQVVAPQQVGLRNELAGTISDVNFESGTQVSKGQLLIQLDTREEQAQLQSAIARAELARATKKRIAKLRDSKIVSQDQYDKAVAELKVAEADKIMIEASISKKILRAPFDAVSGLHQFERGQYLEENTLITTLVGLQDFVWVDFRLPQIHSALPADARVTIAPLFSGNVGVSDAMSWIPVTAPVVARESIMTRESRSLIYRVKVPRVQIRADKGQTELLPNAIVSVNVPIAPPSSKVAVPAIAVLHSSAGSYVYVLNREVQENGAPPAYRALRKSVTLGAQQGDLIIVESGLEAGERIASAGAFKLSEGLLTYVNETVAQSSKVEGQAETDASADNASREAL